MSLLKDIPRLRITRKRASEKRNSGLSSTKIHKFQYDSKEHADQPHVVKFSGGRSSGMLLFTLLENSFLKSERGDVIIFNNTSAEHPATYDFAARCKKLTEEKYGIPFLWTQFQTYEDASGGDWIRRPSYRLVTPTPYSEKNPDGYRYRGEVFEELLSWKRFLPNQHQRICTAQMKLFVTSEFLRDWFAGVSSIPRLGHYYEDSMMSDESLIRMHRKNRGQTPDDILLDKAAYVRSCPSFRPAQEYQKFSDCTEGTRNGSLNGVSHGGRVSLSGENSFDYVSFVGFRADEPLRVSRMKARNYDGVEYENAADPHLVAPEGEYVYAPLAQSLEVTKDDVLRFWKGQKLKFDLPASVNFSNCVFCFLKGSKTLVQALANQEKVEKKLPKKLKVEENTPGKIHWWQQMEEKYGRDLEKEGRMIRNAETAGEKPIIGFWGINGRLSYQRLAACQFDADALSEISVENATLPCDCTD